MELMVLLCLLAGFEQGRAPFLEVFYLMKNCTTTVDAGGFIYKIGGLSEVPVIFN